MDKKGDYVSVVYSEENRPFTKYPDLLTQYLVEKYNLSKGMSILDLGCGRGEFLRGFIKCGLIGYGADQSLAAKSICPEAEIRQINLRDLGSSQLPYEDNAFDVIFTKSVLEHFYYPEDIVKEVYRILKPGGLVITMVPDWQAIHKIFYDDYTHRSPFTIVSLRDMFLINGFDKVNVKRLRQLPFLWKLPWLQPFCGLISLITPGWLSNYSKLVRFSKEIMLLATCIKNK